MKELTGYAMNVTGTQRGDGTWEPRAEVVVIVSEAEYRGGVGGIEKSRRLDTLRFVATADALRRMSEALAEYADTLDELDKQVVATAEKPQ